MQASGIITSKRQYNDDKAILYVVTSCDRYIKGWIKKGAMHVAVGQHVVIQIVKVSEHAIAVFYILEHGNNLIWSFMGDSAKLLIFQNILELFRKIPEDIAIPNLYSAFKETILNLKLNKGDYVNEFKAYIADNIL